MYEINICSPIWDITPDGQLNARAIRIFFAVDLLLLCIGYNIIAFILRKKINKLRLEDKAANQSKIKQLDDNFKKWETHYLLILGDHAVSLGFVMCYSPYQFELILALSYLIIKAIYQIRLHRWQIEIKICKTLFRIINMALLICAMVGLSRTGYDQNGNCYDPSYQFV